MTPQTASLTLPLPPSMQEFITAFIQAVKAGRLYSSGHTLFRQSVQRLEDKLKSAREDRDIFFVGFTRDSLMLSDQFHTVTDVRGKDFLNFFHSLGISHLLIHKEATTQELECVVEILSGAKPGQGQEAVTALHREHIRRIDLGLLDYSVFSGLESAVSGFLHEREEAAIWRQLILRPALAGAFQLDPEQVKTVFRVCDDPAKLKQLLSELDGNLKQNVESLSPAQRGQIIGNFLQNISKTVARIDAGKRILFKENTALLLRTVRPEMRVHILGAAPPEFIEGDDGGVIRDLIEDMPEEELVHLLIEALRLGGAQTVAFSNLFKTSLARFRSAGPLLNVVRIEMHRATQERRPGSLNLWQLLEQLLVHHQESEDFEAQYRKAIEELATSLKIQKRMVEEEEVERLVRTTTEDSLKRFKAKLIIDLLQAPRGGDALTLPLLQSMGETVKHFFEEGKHRLTGNVLRQVFLAVGQLPQKDGLVEEIRRWFSTEDVRTLLKTLIEKCRTFEPREMSPISSTCQLFPDKAGAFLLDLYLEVGDRQGPMADWLITTLASLAPHLARALGSRLSAGNDSDLPRLIELADFFSDQHLAPALEALLDHKDFGIKSQALKTLARLKAPRSTEALARVATEKSWFLGKKTKTLKLQALQALAEMQTPEARAILEQIASTGSGELQKLSRELLEKP